MKFFYTGANLRPSYRYVFQGLFFLTLLLVITAAVLSMMGTKGFLGWQNFSQLESLDVTLRTLSIPPFEIPIKQPLYIIQETFWGGDFLHSSLLNYAFFGLTVLTVVFLFSLISDLPRIYYYVAVAFMVFVLMQFKFEQLALFGRTDHTGFLIVFVAYVPLTFYFHNFSKTSLPLRLLVFAVITNVLGLLIPLFSEVAEPFAALQAWGAFVPFLLLTLFVLLTSQELIYFFAFFISKNKNLGKAAPIHFSVLSLVYLGNLLLVFLKRERIIDWDILYLSPILVLFLSAIVAYYTLEFKFKSFGINYHPWGAWFILSLGAMSFGTVGYYYVTGNDTVVSMIVDAVLQIHLGMGLIFFTYILANFYNLMHLNLDVNKVMYQPANMPYFTANLAGIMAVIAFFLKSGVAPYDHANAGRDIQIADWARDRGDVVLAETYYREAGNFVYGEHRASYSLAQLALAQGDEETAAFYFERSLYRNPSPQAYANVANLLAKNEHFFDGMFKIKQGLRSFQNEGHLENNMGLLYAETNVLDSALFYFDRSIGKAEVNQVAETNFSGLLALNSSIVQTAGIVTGTDSLSVIVEKTNHFPLKANLSALLALNGQQLKNIEPVTDSLLSGNRFSWYVNQAISQYSQADSNYAAQLEGLGAVDLNWIYADGVLQVSALQWYASGYVNHAFAILSQLVSPTSKPEIWNLMGQLALEQGAFTQAAEYFDHAVQLGFADAQLPLAITRSYLMDNKAAISSWENLPKSELKDLMLHWLTMPLDSVTELVPNEQLQFILFRHFDLSVEQIINLLNAQENQAIATMTKSILSRVDYRFEWQPSHNTQLWEKEKIWVKDDVQLATERNAFYLPAVMEAIKKSEEEGNIPKAYDQTVEALRVNKFAVPLLKKYSILAWQMGLETYALAELNDMKNYLLPQDWEELNRYIRQLPEPEWPGASENQ